jgi:hypothetical protein
MIGVLVCLTLGGCVSWYAREDFDQYKGACATTEGNGRHTTMSTSQPSTAPAGPVDVEPQPVHQVEPGVGEVFILRVNGKSYEAMKKTDGKVYIIQEVSR